MERLFAVLSQVTGWPDLHLVDLARAPALLRFDATRHGIVLYEDRPGRFAEFRVHAWKQMLDDEIDFGRPGRVSHHRCPRPVAWMSPVDIAHRQAQTRGRQSAPSIELRPVVGLTIEAWQGNRDLHDATERRLQLGLEAAIDIKRI